MNTPSIDKSVQDQLFSRFGEAIRIGNNCTFSEGVCVEIDEGGTLTIGDRVSIRRGTTIQVHRCATIIIGDDVAVGENSFISSMVGIRIGSGVGISNMVDLHDHNHRERTHANVLDPQITPWASGFCGAPIIIEAGALLSNKVSVTAGVRIGQNSIIGANSIVTRSIAPNTVAAGAPARAIRTFDGPLGKSEKRAALNFSWFGTSIMEHLEGYNAQMVTQSNLPQVGSSVVIEAWRNRGYVQRLHLALQVTWPHLEFIFNNHGKGGATSRDILETIRAYSQKDEKLDVVFFGCGINDVWRRFQGRFAEAVDPSEFDKNYREAVRLLKSRFRRVVCIAETPIGWDIALDVPAVNLELAGYNTIAARAASDAGVPFLNIWPIFLTAAQHFGWPSITNQTASLWSDGVHLSELGDALMLKLLQDFIEENDLIVDLARYELYERAEAQAIFGPLFSKQ